MLKKIASRLLRGSGGRRRAPGNTPPHGAPGHGHQSPKAAAAKTAAREVKKAVNKR